MATKRKRVRSRKPSLKDEISLLGQRLDDSLNRRMEYNELERRCIFIEKQYEDLKDKVVSLLNKDQIEAARICGCPPEVYCLEWIDIILKDDLKKYTPSFGEGITHRPGAI